MEELVIVGDSLRFAVTITKEDLFLNPIGLTVKSSQEVLNNPSWIDAYQPGIHLTRETNNYTGSIVSNEIHIQTENEIRIFKRI